MQMVQGNIWLLCILSLFCLFGFLQDVNGMGDGVPDIFSRDSGSCGASGFVQCAAALDLPSDFCCPRDTTCYSLDHSSSLLCCPSQANCTLIQPVVCDLQSQNATLNPKALGKTTKLNDKLSTCGKGCCPHGYDCMDGHSCKLDADSAKVINFKTTTVTRGVATMTTSMATSTSTTSPADVSPTSPVPIPGLNQNTADCPQFPGAAIAVGFFPGLAVGVIISIGWFFWSKRHAKRSSAMSSPRSASPGTDHMRQRSDGERMMSISDPIPTAAQDFMRTDFLRHQPDSQESDKNNNHPQSRVARTGARVRSLFATPKPTSRDPPPMPVAPPSQVYSRDEPSREGLHNHDPTNPGSQRQQTMLHPNQALGGSSRPTTTFTDMMERVGFQNDRGSPFYPVTSSPQTQKRRHDASPLRRGQNE